MTSKATGQRISLVQRTSFLREFCRGKSVLHLGCTNWPYFEHSLGDDRFLHSVLMESAATVWGVDADNDGIEAMKAQGIPDLFVGDLEKLDSLPIDRSFDVVVAGEVIEHLSNPGLLLTGVQRFMSPQTRLVITTVNSYCAFRFAIYGLRGRGGRSEPVHPDHVAYYSRSTLLHVAHRAGLRTEDFMFYDVGLEHRQFMRASVRWANDLIVRFAPQLADGVIGVFALPGPAKS